MHYLAHQLCPNPDFRTMNVALRVCIGAVTCIVVYFLYLNELDPISDVRQMICTMMDVHILGIAWIETL